MAKVYRQVQEAHSKQHLSRVDMYTTLLETVTQNSSVLSTVKRFTPPPPMRALPSARLLRAAYLLSELPQIEDYRNQITSTFGRILKYDATKKVNYNILHIFKYLCFMSFIQTTSMYLYILY